MKEHIAKMQEYHDILAQHLQRGGDFAADMLPTAEVALKCMRAQESIVKCGDCKHLLRDLNTERHLCMRERMPFNVTLEDFCSKGVRAKR